MLDCYLYLIKEGDDARIGISCLNHPKPYGSWFYQGSKLGYGPFEYKCQACGKIIHAKPEESEEGEN